ncbi:UNVERIFIED_CONTAM: hypothetical protein Sradi_5220300 [Sesamum radiatum]|uniref:Chromo domain-containing protein n=1 Tax=Sesamum radiatum TaxID=300843 RepID=A0AAW2LLN9_SESRA
MLQDDHLVSFETSKLEDVERRYSVHEKKLFVVVHCLRLWRHYFLGSPFVVKTDNTAVSYFMNQPKLTNSQAHWQKMLSEFHFLLEYWAGSSNHVADALSRKADLASLGLVAELASSAVATSIMDRAHELLLKNLAAQGLGEEHTYALVQRAYYWPHMRDEVETYVCTCLICQQDKANNQKKASLLQPLLIPKRSWQSVSMDYIFELPKVGNLGSIITVVDQLSKYATFIAAPKHVTTERFNSMLEEYLRYFVRDTQLYFNAQKSSSTNKIAFEIVTRQQPLIPHTLNSPQDKEDDARNQPSGPQLELTKMKENVAEAILNHRVSNTAKRNHTEYLVKRKGYSSEENTWERVTNLKAFLPLVEAYHAFHALRTSPSQVGENVKGRPRTRHY